MKKPRIGITCGPNIDKLPPYLNALAAAGAEGVVFQVGSCTADTILSSVDGILLPGGGDIDPAFYADHAHPSVTNIDRARDALERDLVITAHARGLPLFGVCRGVQVMGWAMGGQLHQDIPDHRHTPNANRSHLAHTVTIVPGSKLAQILGVPTMEVNSIHHQAVSMAPKSLTIVATAQDGTIEALEDPKHPWFIGVQWHPEEILDQEASQKLYGEFVTACSKRSV